MSVNSNASPKESSSTSDDEKKGESVDMIDLEEKQIKKLAIKQFNRNPKKGIEFSINHKVIQNDPKEVAKFLQQEGILKSKIGEYLGCYAPFNLEVLKEYIKLFDFTSESFEQSLRFENNYLMTSFLSKKKIFFL